MFTRLLTKVAGVALVLSMATAYGQVTASAAGLDRGKPGPNATTMWVTGPTSVPVGQIGTWTYHWSGGGFSGETFYVHFYNYSNGVDYMWYTYNCFSFCSSGQFNYGHSFATCGIQWETYMIDQNNNASQQNVTFYTTC